MKNINHRDFPTSLKQFLRKWLGILYVIAYLGVIFPEYQWDDTTVLIEDEEGNDVTDDFSAEEIQNALYSTENIRVKLKFLEWFY